NGSSRRSSTPSASMVRGSASSLGCSRTSAASQTPSPTSAYNSSSASQWRFTLAPPSPSPRGSLTLSGQDLLRTWQTRRVAPLPVLNAWPSLHPQPLRLLAHFPLSRHHRLRRLLRSKPSNLHGPPAFSRATLSQQHSCTFFRNHFPQRQAPSADDNHGMELFSSRVKRQ